MVGWGSNPKYGSNIELDFCANWQGFLHPSTVPAIPLCIFAIQLASYIPKFLFHLIIVDELRIVPRLCVCPTPVLGAPLSSILFNDIGAVEVL